MSAAIWTGHRAPVGADDLRGNAWALSHLMEFDHPITVGADGLARDEHPADVYAPEVWHDDADDVAGYDRARWELLTGYTGQHGYRGAVMHASEFIGGGLARDILNTPGIYVAVVVEVLPDADAVDAWQPGDPDPEHPEPAGWAVARYVGEVAR